MRGTKKQSRATIHCICSQCCRAPEAIIRFPKHPSSEPPVRRIDSRYNCLSSSLIASIPSTRVTKLMATSSKATLGGSLPVQQSQVFYMIQSENVHPGSRSTNQAHAVNGQHIYTANNEQARAKQLPEDSAFVLNCMRIDSNQNSGIGALLLSGGPGHSNRQSGIYQAEGG